MDATPTTDSRPEIRDGAVDPSTSVTALRSQHPTGLLGIPAGELRVTWRTMSSAAQSRQVAYEIHASASAVFEAASTTGTVWSCESFAQSAPGGELLSREVRYLRVRIATDDGWTRWSGTLRVEAGLAVASDWTAVAVGIASKVAGPSPILRSEFTLREAPVSARLYVSSLGLNEVHLNG